MNEDNIDPKQMYWAVIEENKKPIYVTVCGSCILAEHESYGNDHTVGEKYYRGCKNNSEDNLYQCLCNPDWAELYTIIQNKELPVFKTEEEAVTAYDLDQKVNA